MDNSLVFSWILGGIDYFSWVITMEFLTCFIASKFDISSWALCLTFILFFPYFTFFGSSCRAWFALYAFFGYSLSMKSLPLSPLLLQPWGLRNFSCISQIFVSNGIWMHISTLVRVNPILISVVVWGQLKLRICVFFLNIHESITSNF